KSKRRSTAIWMAAVHEKRAPWRFTTAQSANHPRWSPDGQSLAFLTARADAGAAAPARPQVFVLAMTGGEAVRVTDFPNGVSDFEWSPDGKRLACVTKTGPAKAKAATDLRHYTSPIYKYDTAGWYDDKHAHIWIFDIETRAALQITSADLRDDSEPSWSPDGNRIAFVSHDANQYPSLGGSVEVVAATGGAPVRISDQEGSAHAPRWSSDGKQVAYIASKNDSDDAKIWIAPASGGGSKVASAALDVVPVDLDWSDSGKALLFSAMSRGEQQIFRLNVASGAFAPVTSTGAFLVSYDANEKANEIAFVQTDPAHLGDVFISDLSGHGIRQLTHANRRLYSEVTFQDAERLRYPSVDDFTVEGFLMKPVGWQAGKKYPMILSIHGGPASMWGARFYHDFQMFAAKGWAVLYINPRGSSGYGEKFQRAVEKQWGGKTYDDLMRGVDYALEKYPWIDRDRLGVTGGSFGGFMTNWIVGHTNRFKAAVTISSISNFTSLEGTRDLAYSHAKDFGGDLFQNFDFYWDQSPLKYAMNVKTPVLLMHGDSDHRVPFEQAEQWFRALRHFGVPSELVIFPGENHTYAAQPKHRVDLSSWQIYWFERYLNGNTSFPEPDGQ
ncbi:MAG: S9 family peptidase, partial [Bryobacteraceae bacterium]